MPTVRLQRITVFGLHAISLALFALHLYVRRLAPTPTPIPTPLDAEAAWWGFWPATYAPRWLFLVTGMILAELILFFWIAELRTWRWEKRGREQSDWPALRPPSTLSERLLNLQPIGLLVITFALLAAFFAMPIAHTRWGDAFMLTKGLAWPDPALRIVYSWQAPLDVFLHSLVWRVGHLPFAWADAQPVYYWLSPLAGVGYLWVVLGASHPRLAPPYLTFGLLTSLGLLQLFFGYVENYSFVAVGILAYLWLSLRVLQGHRPLWWAATALALANATHPSSLVLLPSLLWLTWQLYQRANQRNNLLGKNVFTPQPTKLLPIALEVIFPMLLVGGATLILMEAGGHGLNILLTTDRPGGGDARWFVPLWQTATRWEHYTLFSWLHLRDWLNEQMLVAPASFLALFWILIMHNVQKKGDKQFGVQPFTTLQPPVSHRELKFLAIATLSYALFTWVWNPDYGGQRDWDLFSLAALPLTLWFVTLTARSLPNTRYLRAGLAPLIVVQAMHTAMWIYQNTLPWEWPK